MNVLLIADAYEPATISAAQQLHDLVDSLAKTNGVSVTVLIPDASGGSLPPVELQGNITLIRARCPETKNINHLRRVIAEFLLPFFLYRALKKSAVKARKWHGIIWYSPTIFLGPLVAKLKRLHGCRSYLILRDLFPDWALDTGVMRKGLGYRILKQVESYQYRQADIIGVQTPANIPHLAPWDDGTRRIEVLPNWLAPATVEPCSLDVSKTKLSGRRIFVYAGNMGVAQDMKPIIDMAASLREFKDWGFLFVGRGSETEAIRQRIEQDGLDNVLLCDEIQPQEIPALFTQCHIGIVALDPRHTTHNIPGKFVAYMRSGLPVLARVNHGNDLLALVNKGGVGLALDDSSPQALFHSANNILEWSEQDLRAASERARSLWTSEYSAQACAEQVIHGLKA